MELLEGEFEKVQAVVDEVLEKYASDREKLIPILQDTQKKLSYLPEEAMKMIASGIGIPAVEVYGVATFYNQFRLNPPGKHQLKVCMGTACHMARGHIIMESFERRLDIKEGETTPDREYSLERVACVGCCALAPVVVVNEQVEAKVRPTRVDGILLGFDMEKKAAEKERLKAAEAQKQAGEEGREDG